MNHRNIKIGGKTIFVIRNSTKLLILILLRLMNFLFKEKERKKERERVVVNALVIQSKAALTHCGLQQDIKEFWTLKVSSRTEERAAKAAFY